MLQTKESDRIEAIDALRGFAVMAILLVHHLEHFIFPVYPTDSPTWLTTVDSGVCNAIFALFAGKAYAIFAILFGFTFSIQMANQQKKGKDFGYRYLWRLVLLIGFATLNAAFFPAGDVLLLFVIVGTVLFLARHLSEKAVLLLAIFFTLQPLEWYHYFMSLVDTSHQLPNYNVDAMYAAVAEVTKSGNFMDFLWNNVTLGQKASLMWAVGAGRATQTAGLFLIGYYLGRRGFFANTVQNLRFWTRTLTVSAISFCPLLSLKDLIMTSESPLIQQTVGTSFDMWQKLAFTFVLVSSFMLLYQSAQFQRFVSPLRSYGRMSLTNYISQSIIGAIIYFPFGLYLAPHCGYTLSILIALIVFVGQILFSNWWLEHHKQGPLESIWHHWTWLKKS